MATYDDALLQGALSPWWFDLPDARIAREAVEPRDAARLLVIDDSCTHAHVRDLPDWLRPGDLVVVNDVRVRRARIQTHRASGGRVEVLLVRDDEALCRPSRRLSAGERLICRGDGAELGAVTLLEALGDGRWRVRCDPDADTLAELAGSVPLPPYFGRDASEADAARYQTVYARRGALAAAAAPTAGLHFTDGLLARLGAKGVARAHVTLEVGLGTFKPLTADQLARGVLHEERYEVPEATWHAIEACRARAGRVVAIGTTTARVLESASGPGPGSTAIFLRHRDDFRVVDVLFTNFHLPASSLLMLVTAFGGHARVMAAYRRAVDEGYRFYSYGDACLVFRDGREDPTGAHARSLLVPPS